MTPPDDAGRLAPRAIYLHGFASSARSSKATFFRERFATRGVALDAPDFNEPDFTSLTVTRMLAQTAGAIAAARPHPVILIGSSLGAFVAVLAAARHARDVTRMILLAPALRFTIDDLGKIGDRSPAAWAETGVTNVFHYGFGRMMPLGYGLCADIANHDAAGAPVDVPTLAFQGRRDTVVDPTGVERWAAGHPGTVKLVLVDDDHQLQGSLDDLWRETEAFIWRAR